VVHGNSGEERNEATSTQTTRGDDGDEEKPNV